MTPEQVAESFSDYFNETEIGEMKEYKHIYFLGKKFDIEDKKVIYSARENKRRRM